MQATVLEITSDIYLTSQLAVTQDEGSLHLPFLGGCCTYCTRWLSLGYQKCCPLYAGKQGFQPCTFIFRRSNHTHLPQPSHHFNLITKITNDCIIQYFGSMAGVRGFSDPNVQINPNGKSVFYQ
jgi:hypothetical protein